MTDKGYVAQYHNKKAVLKHSNKFKPLIAAENKDRKAMSADITIANGHPEWQADIQAKLGTGRVDKTAND